MITDSNLGQVSSHIFFDNDISINLTAKLCDFVRYLVVYTRESLFPHFHHNKKEPSQIFQASSSAPTVLPGLRVSMGRGDQLRADGPHACLFASLFHEKTYI